MAAKDRPKIVIDRDPPMRIPTSPEASKRRQAGTETGAPWPLDRIDSRPLAFDGLYHYFGLGANITVFQVDTGILPTHNEFTGRAIAYGNTIDESGNIDQNGHGTHVGSLMIGTTYGAAKVRVLPLFVLHLWLPNMV